VDLGEGAKQDQVGVLGGQFQGLGIVVGHHVLAIRLVHPHDDPLGNGVQELREFADRVVSAGGIVRIADDDQLGLVVHRRRHGAQIMLVVRVQRYCSPTLEMDAGGQRVHDKAVFAENYIFPRGHQRPDQHIDHFVGAVPEDEILRLDSQMHGQPVGQVETGRIGIAVHIQSRLLDRLHHGGQWTFWIFVAGKLDHVVQPQFSLHFLDGAARDVRTCGQDTGSE